MKSESKQRSMNKLHRDNSIQVLINKFVSGELAKIEPVFDCKHGYSYPVIDAILGNGSDSNEFLERLFEIDFLKRELFDKMVLCPFCDSVEISAHYCCPHCKSFNIKKSALVEHIRCGYIDSEERFLENEKLFCPRCKEELPKIDRDYRRAGVWCACIVCGKSFDIPVPVHFCRNCRREFTFEEAFYRDVYAYSLSREIIREANADWNMITPIKELLQISGFNVESPSVFKGRSGASHVFDMKVYPKEMKKGNITVIDLAISSEDFISEKPVTAMFAKIYDVSPSKACMIAIPKMNENGRKLAKLYKIELIEGKKPQEIAMILKDCLRK